MTKALARALYSRAPVLVLDDIFGGLDSSTGQDIHNRLFGPKGVVRVSKLTVIFATHSGTF
jgi:ABC-type nitrate/sulfonate/bicarbonate transport system ATPase subunit